MPLIVDHVLHILDKQDNRSGGEWKRCTLSWEAELTLLALIPFLCILSQLMLSNSAAACHVPFKTYTNSFLWARLALKVFDVLLEALIVRREKLCYCYRPRWKFKPCFDRVHLLCAYINELKHVVSHKERCSICFLFYWSIIIFI